MSKLDFENTGDHSNQLTCEKIVLRTILKDYCDIFSCKWDLETINKKSIAVTCSKIIEYCFIFDSWLSCDDSIKYNSKSWYQAKDMHDKASVKTEILRERMGENSTSKNEELKRSLNDKIFVLMEKIKQNIDKLRTKDKKSNNADVPNVKLSDLDEKLEDADSNETVKSGSLTNEVDTDTLTGQRTASDHKDLDAFSKESDELNPVSTSELTQRKIKGTKNLNYNASSTNEKISSSIMSFASTQTDSLDDLLISSPKKEKNSFRKKMLTYFICIIAFNFALIVFPICSYFRGFLGGLSLLFLVFVYIKRFLRISIRHDEEPTQTLKLPQVMLLNSQQKTNEDKLCEWVRICVNDSDINEPFASFMSWDGTDWAFSFPSRKGQSDDSKDRKLIATKTLQIAGASVTIVPELPRPKYWICDYPICVRNFHTKESHTLVKDLAFKDNTEEEHFKRFFNQDWSFVLIYFDTDPNKEFWFNHLVKAAKKIREGESPNDYFIAFSNDDSPKRLDALMTDQYKKKNLIYKNPEKFKMKYQSSKNDIEELQNFCSPGLLFINHLVSRISYDIIRINFLKDDIKAFVEYKFIHANIPFFVDEIEVIDLDFGSKLPLIRSASNGFYDETGLWISLDIMFSGCVKSTMRTKVNLLKLKTATDTTKIADDATPQEEGKSGDHIGEKNKQDFYGAGKWYNTVLKVVSNPIVQKIKDFKSVNSAMEWMSSTPITVTMSITKCCGTVKVNIPNPPSDRMWYGFSEMPDMQVEIALQVGTTELNYDFLKDFLVSTMKQQFQKLFVLPNMDDILIPTLHDWTKDYASETDHASFPNLFHADNLEKF